MYTKNQKRILKSAWATCTIKQKKPAIWTRCTGMYTYPLFFLKHLTCSSYCVTFGRQKVGKLWRRKQVFPVSTEYSYDVTYKTSYWIIYVRFAEVYATDCLKFTTLVIPTVSQKQIKKLFSFLINMNFSMYIGNINHLKVMTLIVDVKI